MITVKRSSRELNKVEIYRMTLDNSITSCKDLPDDYEIEVDAWLEYEDEKENGKIEEIFAILATDGSVYACTSKTFARNVLEIDNVFDGATYTIIKKSGTTKAGKPFIMAALKY